MTILFAIFYFLLVVHWYRSSIGNRFRDIHLQNSCNRDKDTEVKQYTRQVSLCSLGDIIKILDSYKSQDKSVIRVEAASWYFVVYSSITVWSPITKHHKCRSIHHQWSVGSTWCLAMAGHAQKEWKLFVVWWRSTQQPLDLNRSTLYCALHVRQCLSDTYSSRLPVNRTFV